METAAPLRINRERTKITLKNCNTKQNHQIEIHMKTKDGNKTYDTLQVHTNGYWHEFGGER